MWRNTTLRGGLGPDGVARTAAISRRTDDVPADEFMESRRRHDNAEVRVDRQEIGEYAAMCCKNGKDKKRRAKEFPRERDLARDRRLKTRLTEEAIIVRCAMRNGKTARAENLICVRAIANFFPWHILRHILISSKFTSSFRSRIMTSSVKGFRSKSKFCF